MHFLDKYHARTAEGIRITADQASRFAKDVAGDFNPIHDPDNRRFCVPGDILFALALKEYGISPRMTFRFLGMVDESAVLHYPQSDAGVIDVTVGSGRPCMRVERAGTPVPDTGFTEQFIRSYVAFSGQNFPHYLQPLMADRGVMFNPDRPMVFYDSMDFTLDQPGDGDTRPVYTRGALEPVGKRGSVLLEFDIVAGDGAVIGRGSKKLLIAGLQAYDDGRMQALITAFNEHKQAWEQGRERS